MRDVAKVGTLLAAGLLLVFGSAACSNAGLQSSLPAGPSGIGSNVSPGPSGIGSNASPGLSATLATDHTPPPAESDEIDNPCTGQTTTVYLTPVKATWGPSGGFSVIVDVTTDDGFSGRLTNTGKAASAAGDSGVVSERFTGRATLRNDSGQMILYEGNFRLLMVDGNIIIDVDDESLRCVGKPVA